MTKEGEKLQFSPSLKKPAQHMIYLYLYIPKNEKDAEFILEVL